MKKKMDRLLCCFCMIIFLFIPTKIEAADYDSHSPAIIVEKQSLSTTHARIMLSTGYTDYSSYPFNFVSYEYTSVIAKIGNKEYSMNLVEEDSLFKVYSLDFPTPVDLNEQVVFKAVCSCGKILTATETIIQEECKIEWGEVSYINPELFTERYLN